MVLNSETPTAPGVVAALFFPSHARVATFQFLGAGSRGDGGEPGEYALRVGGRGPLRLILCAPRTFRNGAHLQQLTTVARQEAMPTIARSRSFSLSLSLVRSSYISLLLSFSLDRPRSFLLSLAVFSGSLSLSLAPAISRSSSLSLSTALALSCYLLLYSL